MSYSIDDIEGVGPARKAKFNEAGVKTTADLLEKGATPAGRKALAEATGINGKVLLTLTNQADLMRIKGVAGQWAELLQASGVDTVKELRNRNAANLAKKMEEVNAEKNLTNGDISEKKVTGWVEQAKELDPILSY